MYRPAPPPPPMQQQQLAALPDPADVAQLIARNAQGFARRNPVVTGYYLFGIVVLLFFSTGIPLSQQQIREYNSIMDSIDQQAEYNASQDYWQARNAYQASRGWFFQCDGLCQRNKRRMEETERTLNAIRQEGYARMSDAKRVAGMFSQVAVDETKDSFWQYFDAGKQFAKRRSMWDAMFMGFRSMGRRGRDESWMEYALKLLIQVLINFSMGLIMALVMFVMGLYSIVRSYQANPIVAVVFFLGASAAAFSFVASYLLAVFGAAGASVYGLLKVAESSSRAAQLADQQQQQRRQQMGYRPHYE